MFRLLGSIVFSMLLLTFSFQEVYAEGQVLFYDDFSDGDDDGWTKVHDFGSNTLDIWKVNENGEYGGKVASTFTAGNSIIYGESWTDYEVKFTMKPIQGADKNFIFRIEKANELHPNGDWWYEIHVQSDVGRINLNKKGIGFESFNSYVLYPISNNAYYDWRIQAVGSNIRVWVKETGGEEMEIFNVTDEIEPFLSGGIGLRIGTGTVPNTEVYFDNILVTELTEDESDGPGLNIPHLSQLDPIWKDDIYDGTSNTIGNWGCALTAASMILNYHGFTLTPDGLPNTPQTLNQYLLAHNGYTRSGGVDWSTVTRFARDVQNAGLVDSDHYLLEFAYAPYDVNSLAQDIEAGNPSLVKIVTEDKGTTDPRDDNLHFVVANNVTDTSLVGINDPLDIAYVEDTLQGKYAGKEYRQIGRFIPSHTDLSYLWIYQTNPDVDIAVEVDGRLTGKLSGETYAEIPNAFYQEDGVIALPSDPDLRMGGDEIANNTFALPKPTSGVYFIHVTPKSPGEVAKLDIRVYNDIASQSAYVLDLESVNVSPKVIKLEILPDGSSDIANLDDNYKQVGFEYIDYLLDKYFESGDIQSERYYDLLKQRLNNAEGKYFVRKLGTDPLNNDFLGYLTGLNKRSFVSNNAYGHLHEATMNLIETLSEEF